MHFNVCYCYVLWFFEKKGISVCPFGFFFRSVEKKDSRRSGKRDFFELGTTSSRDFAFVLREWSTDEQGWKRKPSFGVYTLLIQQDLSEKSNWNPG